MKNMLHNRYQKFISTTASVLAFVMLIGAGARTGVYAVSESDVPSDILYEDRLIGVGSGRSVVTESVDANPTETDTNSLSRSGRRNISVYIDGETYSGRAFLYKETTYVGFREFCSTVAGAAVTWDDSTGTAYAKTSQTTVSAVRGTEYVSANGRYFWAKTGILIENGTMYVPIRPLVQAYGASLNWDGTNYSVSITRGSGTVTSGTEYYRSDEVYWLSKIIHAESRGESLTGKIAVGNVVLNRVANPDYPNTIYGVIFDKKYGVQFSPVADGSIYLDPDAESVIAAKLCLEGYTVSTSILFFINSNIAENMWVTNSRPFAVSIGKHDFYA